MNLRRSGLYSIFVLVIVCTVVFLFNLYDSVEKKKINSHRDGALVAYDLAKGFAVDSVNLLTISSQDSYLQAKEKYRKMLSNDLWSNYFSNDRYLGSDNRITVGIRNISGEIVDDNDFIFKLDMVIVGGNKDVEVSSLVFIRNNIVYRIQSLG